MKNGIPEGPYTLWLDYGYEGWKPTDYDTLEEALRGERFYNNWVITRAVRYEVKDITQEDPS
jgi:hypothetical protein